MDQQTKNWYVVYTRPKWEKKVAKQLELKEVEYYCPMNRIVRHWSDRKKIVLEPLFTSYVFVCISKLENVKILETDGVMNFVYWLKKPAVIHAEEIDTIKRFMNEYDNVKLEKSSVKINDQVKVISGPFIELQGNVLEVKNKTVKITLPSMGYVMIAEIDKTNIEILSLPTAKSKTNLSDTILNNGTR